MNQVFPVACGFLRDEDGVTAIEYALIAATIVVVVTVTVLLVGQQVHAFFLELKQCFDAPSSCRT